MRLGLNCTIILTLCTISTATMAQSLTLYAGTNFSGDSRQVGLASTNVGGFVARSAVATGKWRVCSGPFGLIGCRTIEGRVADLGGSGLAVMSAVFGLGTGTGSNSGSGQPQTTTNGNQPYPPQANTYATAAGRTASFFAQPQFNGQPMLACPDKPSNPSSSCAKKSAEQFCRLSGFAKLAYSAYSAQGYLEDVLCAR
jgi:hypothetical protein